VTNQADLNPEIRAKCPLMFVAQTGIESKSGKSAPCAGKSESGLFACLWENRNDPILAPVECKIAIQRL